MKRTFNDDSDSDINLDVTSDEEDTPIPPPVSKNIQVAPPGGYQLISPIQSIRPVTTRNITFKLPPPPTPPKNETLGRLAKDFQREWAHKKAYEFPVVPSEENIRIRKAIEEERRQAELKKKEAELNKKLQERIQVDHKDYLNHIKKNQIIDDGHYSHVRFLFTGVPFKGYEEWALFVNQNKDTKIDQMPLTKKQKDQLKFIPDDLKPKWIDYFQTYNWVEVQREHKNTASMRFWGVKSPYPEMPPHKGLRILREISFLEMRRIYENEFIIQ